MEYLKIDTEGLVFIVSAILFILIVSPIIFRKAGKDRSTQEICDAFLLIAHEAQKNFNIAYPGILTSDIAKHAKVDYWKAWTVLSEMSTQDPPLVHRIGDRWYPGSGWKR